MSIFGAIKKAIFGDHGPLGGQFSGGGAAKPDGPTGGQQATAPRAPANPAPGGQAPAPQGQKPASPASPTPSAPPPAQADAVDVDKVLTEKAATSGQQLNWRTSIVDLLKLLGLDSSLDARKQLAEEVGYGGPKDGSAEMNIALHKAVMRKLAENGGKVPADLTD